MNIAMNIAKISGFIKTDKKFRSLTMYCLSAFVVGTALAHNGGPTVSNRVSEDSGVIAQQRFTKDSIELDQNDIQPQHSGYNLINELRIRPETKKDAADGT